MDWIVSLFTESSIAHDVVVYSLVIALGVLLGKIKFFGISSCNVICGQCSTFFNKT